MDATKLALNGLVRICVTLAAVPSHAMEGYWLDQYNAMLYLATFRLDHELHEMRQRGASKEMVHADALPNPLLRWIGWRARLAGLSPVAWIQRPTAKNLARVGRTH